MVYKKLILLIIGAFILRLMFILVVPSNPVSDFRTYDTLGWTWAETGKYSTSSDGPPSTYRPPGYPFVLALIYKLVGHDTFYPRLLNALFGAVNAGLIFLLVRQAGKSGLARPILGALIYAFYPPAIFYTGLLATETIYTTLLLVSMLVAKETRLRSGAGSQRKTAILGGTAIGALGGIAALIRPTHIALLPVLALWSVGQSKKRQGVTVVLVAFVSLCLVLLPWTIRNFRVTGRFIPVSSNGGVNFYIGNNTNATGGFVDADKDSLMAGLSDWEKGAVGWRSGLEYLFSHPGKVMLIAPLKLFNLLALDSPSFYWTFYSLYSEGQHTIDVILNQPGWLLVLLLPIVGSALLIIGGLLGLRKTFSLPMRGFFLSCLGAWVIFHMLFFGGPRFLLPIVPILAISLGGLVSKLIESHATRRFEWSMLVIPKDGVDFLVSLVLLSLPCYWIWRFFDTQL